MPDVHEAISRTIIGLLIDEPFFAHLLGSIPREVSNRTETVGLELGSSGLRLLINEKYFLKTLRSEQQRRAVIKHEALHATFFHCCRRSEQHIKDLFDIAADLVVNQFVRESALPENAVTLSTLSALKLKPNDSLENYYAALVSHYCPTMNAGDDPDPDSADGGGRNNYGDASEGNTDTSSKAKRESAAAGALRRVLKQQRHGDHQHWGAADTATTFAVENLLIRARDRTPLSDWGSIPGRIGDLIAMILEQRKPQVDWRRRLRLFGSSSRRTRVVHTLKRVSKRFGTRPGIKIKRFQRLLIALDTSGSIDTASLELFFSEVRGMWRHGAEVTVIECDNEVQRVYPYRGTTPEAISGGGGTEFDPVFQYARSNRQLQFDGMVYLTDGYASEPRIAPPCRLLWVLTPDGTRENLTFGDAIQLK